MGNKVECGVPFTLNECTTSGCTPKELKVTIDQNWRWLHTTGGYTNCFDKGWKCTGEDCAETCALEGEDYEATAGVTEIEGGLKLQYVTTGGVGSRLYLLDGEKYYM